MPEVAADEQLLPYALCTHDDVQIALQGTTSLGPSKQQIARLINLFTETVQGSAFLNRQLEQKERDVFFDVADPCVAYEPLADYSMRAPLLAAPVLINPNVSPPAPFIQVWNSSDRIYDPSTLLTLYTDYDVDAERGIVRRLNGGLFRSGPRALRVLYVGGLVIPAQPQNEPLVPAPIPAQAPEDLRHACAMQVAAWFSRRKELGLESLAAPGGGAVRLGDPTKLLAHVRLVLARYRIFRGIS